MMIHTAFFNRDAMTVAKALLGKRLCVKYRRVWLVAGISKGRDEHLYYRFIDAKFAGSCTKNPLTARQKDFVIHEV